MRHVMLVVVGLLLSGCRGQAPASGPTATGSTPATTKLAAETTAPDARFTKPFFFRIEKGTAVSYALGTFHVGVTASLLPAEVNAALRAAKTAVFETETPTGAALQQLLTRTDGRTLRDELGEKHWPLLVDKFGAAAERINTFTTAMATTLVMIIDLPPTPGLDAELLAQAKTNGLAVQFLEDITFQAALMDKFYDVSVLRLYLEQPALAREGMEKMKKLYLAGDAQGLLAESQDESAWLQAGKDRAFVQAFQKELLYDRNQNWVTKLSPQFEAGGLFVAVGALHFLGDQGLVALLEKNGFRVTRVVPK